MARTGRVIARCIIAVALAVGIGRIAAAQGGVEPGSVAAWAERAALVDLRLRPDTTPDDYRAAMLVLERAARLAPDDAELARRIAAAAWSTGERELLIDATSRVVRLDPRDTVAALRLITARIAALQTAEERLAAYDRFLGERGEAFDPSIRSRLALDAALLLRERGDSEGFAERLALAARLDPSNKEVWSLAASYYAERTGDPVGLLELRIETLEADPFDLNLYQEIAYQLAREGEFDTAARFFRLYVNLRRRALQRPDDPILSSNRSVAERWYRLGPEVIVEEVAIRLADARRRVGRQYREGLEEGIPEDELTKPDEVHLPTFIERARLLAALAAGDDASAEIAINEMQAESERLLEEANTRRRALLAEDPGAVPEVSFEEALRAYAETQLARALANKQIGALNEAVGRFRDTEGELGRQWRWLLAWLVYRVDGPESALRLVGSLGPPDETGVLLLAEIAVAQGREEDARRLYGRFLDANPYNPLSAFARSKLIAAGLIEEGPSELGRRLGEVAASMPGWVDDAVTSTTRMISLAVEPVAFEAGPLDPTRLLVRLTNVSPEPLAVGPGRPISSRLLLSPQASLGIGVEPQPEVVELDRRLRLAPRETLEVVLPVERGYTGLLFDAASHQAIRQRWRAVQGFRINAIGAFEPGPGSLADETDPLLRLGLTEANLPAPELARTLRQTGSDGWIRAVIGAASQLRRRHTDEHPEVVAALTDALDGADSLGRAAMLALLPAAAEVPAMAPFDATARERAPSLLVGDEAAGGLAYALTLLTRVTDPADPVILAMAQPAALDRYPDLAELAALLGRRLQRGRASLATAGPGPDALGGPARTTPRGELLEMLGTR